MMGVDSEEVQAIADMLDIDLVEAWQAGDVPSPQGYFDLHTKEQLLAIAKEVKVSEVLLGLEEAQQVTQADLAKMSKSNLVATLMSAMPTRESVEAGIAMPKEIARAKQPRK